MARYWFGGGISDGVYSVYNLGSRQLLELARTNLRFYDAETAGTQYTDLLDADGNPVDLIITDLGQVPRFQGPDGVVELWADDGDNQRHRMVAQDAAAMQAAVTDAETAATAAQAAQAAAEAVGDSNDTIVEGLVTDPASATATALSASYAPRLDLLTDLARPFYIAHRGGGAWAYPENSMQGYEAAARSGFAIEVDLRLLGDGTIVCSHDEFTDGMMTDANGTPVTGLLSALTYAEWKQLRWLPVWPGATPGVPVTLDEVLGRFGGRTLIVAEFKDAGTIDGFIDRILGRGLQRSVIASSFTYSHVQQAAASGVASMAMSSTAAWPTISELQADGVEFVGCNYDNATPANIDPMVAAGIEVLTWTINTRALASTVLANGVAGLLSDQPWTVSEWYPSRPTDPFHKHEPDWPLATVGNEATARASNFRFAGRAVRRYKYTASSTGILAADWAGRLDSSGSKVITVRHVLRFLPGAENDTASVGIAYGTFKDEDSSFINANTPGQTAYSFYFRRNGDFSAVLARPGQSHLSLGSSADGPLAAAVGAFSQPQHMEFVVTPTDVTYRNLTSGIAHTVANADHRPTDGRLAFTFYNTTAEISDVVVEVS